MFSILRKVAQASHSDDAMIRRQRKPMTTSQVKRAMDRRFDRLERATNRRFDQLERTKVDKTEFRKAITDLRSGLRGEMRREIAASAAETRRCIDATAAETRRHFDVVGEALRDEIRRFGDPIAAHTDRLENHETRIAKLERHAI